MTTLNLSPDRWAYGGIDLSSYAVLVQQVTGADEFPKLRGDDAPYSGLTGRLSLGKVADSKRIALALFMSSLDVGGTLLEATSPRQARKNLDALYTVFGKRAQQALVRTMPDASTRTSQAEVVDVTAFSDVLGGEAFGLAVDFQLADPFFYGAQVTPNAAIGASPTVLSITNPGTVKTRKMVLDFLGPITSPRVTNPANGEYVECLVTVVSGKHLIIDVGAFTASNDGVNAIGSIRHSGALPFLELEPGVNALSVTSSAPGGSLTVSYSPAYL